MKTKFYLVLALILACFIGQRPACADMSTTDIYEANNATPGLSKISDNNTRKGLGNLLQGRSISGVYGNTNGTSQAANVDGNSPSTTVSGYRLVLWNVPTYFYSINLGNGLPGQMMTIVKQNTGTVAGKISPATKTGYTDITLTNQGEGVTLQYMDDTTGWVPVGFFGGSTSVVPKVNH